MPKRPREVSPFYHFFAGWLGGSLACVLLSPLEVVKTRLQSSQTVVAGQPRATAYRLGIHIVKTEGIAGLYRGLLPHLLGVGPSRAFYFGSYNLLKRKLGKDGAGFSGAPLHLGAAALASMTSVSIMSPVWVVKTRLQLQNDPIKPIGAGLRQLLAAAGARIRGAQGAAAAASSAVAAAEPALAGALGSLSDASLRAGSHAVSGAAHGASAAAASGAASAASSVHAAAAAAEHHGNVAYKGIADAFRRVYREEGMRAFYRGLTASYLGVFETAFQFAIYGSLKERVTEYRIGGMRAQAAADARAPLPSDPAELARAAYGDAEAFFTSATAKLAAALLTYPHEVLRTRMREQRSASPRYGNVFQTASLIFKEEGMRGLYGGMGVHMVRTVPNAAILLMVVEKVVGGAV